MLWVIMKFIESHDAHEEHRLKFIEAFSQNHSQAIVALHAKRMNIHGNNIFAVIESPVYSVAKSVHEKVSTPEEHKQLIEVEQPWIRVCGISI